MELEITQDGAHTLYSADFDATYHSKYGAIQEAQTVFINAALAEKMEHQLPISILEVGFGTGLNALLSFVLAQEKDVAIHYTTFEAFPISREMYLQLNFPTLIPNLDAATILQEMHECEWSKPIHIGKGTFTKYNALIQTIHFHNQFDIIYFDAFAPSTQPELWETPIFQKMFDTLKPNGILTTYCAKGQVKRNLKAAGFIIESLPGPIGKREMTRAKKPPIAE